MKALFRLTRLVRPTLAATAFCLLAGSAFGQDVIRYSLTGTPSEAAAGSTFTAVLRAEIDPGWHLYSMNVPEGGPIPTTITVVDSPAFEAGGGVVEPTPIPWFDQNFNMETNYFETEADFQVPVRVKAGAPEGEQQLEVKVRFMLCNDNSCLPPQTKTTSAAIRILPAPPGAAAPPVAAPATSAVKEKPASPEAAPSPTESLPSGTLAYLWFSMTMGALALLTPCVFPMIPITVSYFTKRESLSRGRSLFEAGLYSVGIVGTFTLLGFLLTFLFGAGGINRLAANPWVNLGIAAIFIVFALSLFGVLELQLPSGWLNAVNRRSARTSGLLGILLMALTFSLTSFTCTVPFVGTVMVAALQGDLLWSLLGVTAFATVFATPFFLLALFPNWLQSLPRSGSWMLSVKVVMGFLELAAALKFLSNVDLVYQWEILTRPVFITVWLAIGLVAAVYLLGWFHFPHETPRPSVGATRVLFAIFFLATTFYLLRGLLGFSLGELDAFLPPRDYGVTAETGLGGAAPGQGEKWLSNYEEGLREAQATNRTIFLDFTGYTCTNCRWMEANIFTAPEVQALFSQMILVRLYTDGTEPEHEANQQLEQERFNTIALPFYALISPSGETIATFPGMTRNKSEFIAFLQKGI